MRREADTLNIRYFNKRKGKTHEEDHYQRSINTSATDLPSKKKTPAAPAPVAAPVAAPAESNDSLSISYGQDFSPNSYNSKTDDAYTIAYTHKLGGGFTVGGVMQPVQYSSDNTMKMTGEGQFGYSLPSMAGLTLGGKVGLGEKFQSSGNFGYYALYGTADYKVADKLTWNAVQYRYRNAFDTANNFESHQVGTGVTYALTDTYAINAKVFRNYDNNFSATGDGAAIGVTAKF